VLEAAVAAIAQQAAARGIDPSTLSYALNALTELACQQLPALRLATIQKGYDQLVAKVRRGCCLGAVDSGFLDGSGEGGH